MISKPDYSKYAEMYDAAEESGAEIRDHNNDFIEKLLKKYRIKTVLDLSCGTGSQVFWLVKRGYQVIGVDICPAMLRVAKRKARKEKIAIKFLHGDMRTTQLGQFDAVITIFNAIGHLNKANFSKTIRNIYKNLNHGGIYIFDTFNTNMKNKLELNLSVDATTTTHNTQLRKIQTCKINKKNGIMTVVDEEHIQKNLKNLKIKKWQSTLQTYTFKQLKDILNKNSFEILNHFGPHGSKFSEKNSSILIVAKKT